MIWTTLGLAAMASTSSLHIEPGVHLLHTLEPLHVHLDVPPPTPSEGVHTSTVYGYMQGTSSRVSSIDLDSLTHIAWHAVYWDSEGNITNTAAWAEVAPTLVAQAHAVGTRVHINLMPESSTHDDVLLNPTRRANAVSQLAALVDTYGADGVSIDIEGMDSDLKEQLVDFTRELRAEVPEVIVATPLIDWSGSYDYDELAAASDGLFVMGYDSHGSWSGPGPISMMDDGGIWPYWTLPHSLDEEYRLWGAPDDKIIMGLPLYGGIWTTPSMDYPALDEASEFYNHWSMSELLDAAEVHGRRFEEHSVSAWMWDASTLRQFWYDDPETLEVKMSWALDEGLQGIGFWEVSYATGEPEFWDMVDDLTMTEEEEDPVIPDDSGSPDDPATPDDTGTPDDTAAPDDTGIIGDDGGTGSGSGDDGGSTGDDGAGSSGGGTDGGSGTSDGVLGSDDEDDTGVETDTSKGCGCASTPASSHSGAAWLLVGMAGFLQRRRRQR